MFKSIDWSDEFQPCDTCRYNHVIGKTPFGDILISWKGWKEYPGFDAELDWSETTHIHEYSLEATKQACEEDYNKRLQSCLKPTKLVLDTQKDIWKQARAAAKDSLEFYTEMMRQKEAKTYMETSME